MASSGAPASVSNMSSTAAAPVAPLGGTLSAAALAVELTGMLARLAELTDAVLADTCEGDREVDAARIDAVATLERIQAAALRLRRR